MFHGVLLGLSYTSKANSYTNCGIFLPFSAVIVGCLPPFKSLFSNRTSSSGGRYSSKRTRGVTNPPLNSTTIQRKSSIPLQSYDEGYNARIRAGEMVYMSDSQTEIVRVGDEEMAELGMRGIRVRSDFVSSFFDRGGE